MKDDLQKVLNQYQSLYNMGNEADPLLYAILDLCEESYTEGYTEGYTDGYMDRSEQDV